MARPKGIVGNKRPNTTAVRIQPGTRELIERVHRKIIGGDSNHPLGDKLKSVLLWIETGAYRKKVEGLELQIQDLHEALEIEKITVKVRNKGLRT
jgi:hypothetical protein